VPSQRQIEANRRNARLSTGPKTPEGKAKAARNRSLHGLRSHNPHFSAEDPNPFAAPLTFPQSRRPQRRPVSLADLPLPTWASFLERRLGPLSGGRPSAQNRISGWQQAQIDGRRNVDAPALCGSLEARRPRAFV
jgi:hypothetical protein